MERQRSRQRSSRDRSYPNTRDVSPDVDPYRRPYSTHQFAKKKRVKFNDQEDIRVFKKQDQPIAKALTEDQILQVRQQIEKQISRTYDFNWDQKKHFDALSQQNSMKQQKEKQKELYEKLMGMKQQIQFYTPYILAIPSEISSMAQAGIQSTQREAHSQRIKDVLGCYYTQINEIPNQPIFDVASQCNKNQPKVVKFNPGGINQGEQFVSSKNKNERQMKGILRIPGETAKTSASKQSQQREISPRLLWLLKDMQVNKTKYNKEMTELLLKPFKDSGQLDYWMTNQTSLNQKLKNQPIGTQPPPSNFTLPIPSPSPQPQTFQPIPRISPSPSNQFAPQFQYDPTQSKTEKYKTVPCKYFHSPQGCVKTQNCTFIHDQRYRGVPLPFSNPNPIQTFKPQNTYGNGNFQGNQGFQRNPQVLPSYPSYPQNQFQNVPNMAPKNFNNYQNPNTGMYMNQGNQYPQGNYNYQNRYFGQGGQQPQQVFGKSGQVGQQPNPNQVYGNYGNPQQMQMYYNQGQGQGPNMQGRGSTQR